MNKYTTILLGLVFAMLCSTVHADKPAWAGKGKPTAEQKAAHKAAMNEKQNDDDRFDDDHDDYDDNVESKREKAAGKAKRERTAKTERVEGEPREVRERDAKELALQGEHKTNQTQKELERGSDKGKEARQTSRKWWKFWGSEDDEAS
jgi:hypothetical protein